MLPNARINVIHFKSNYLYMINSYAIVICLFDVVSIERKRNQLTMNDKNLKAGSLKSSPIKLYHQHTKLIHQTLHIVLTFFGFCRLYDDLRTSK